MTYTLLPPPSEWALGLVQPCTTACPTGFLRFEWPGSQTRELCCSTFCIIYHICCISCLFIDKLISYANYLILININLTKLISFNSYRTSFAIIITQCRLLVGSIRRRNIFLTIKVLAINLCIVLICKWVDIINLIVKLMYFWNVLLLTAHMKISVPQNFQ